MISRSVGPGFFRGKIEANYCTQVVKNPTSTFNLNKIKISNEFDRLDNRSFLLTRNYHFATLFLCHLPLLEIHEGIQVDRLLAFEIT